MFPLVALVVGAFGFVLLVALINGTVKLLREYERAVVFTLGRFNRVRGPGLVLLVPFIQEMVRVDLRIQVIEIPTQNVISRDTVSMKVDDVLYFDILKPFLDILNKADKAAMSNGAIHTQPGASAPLLS
jgi:regulator of protease activity HflC (stomatin/prohibitin superfamily)